MLLFTTKTCHAIKLKNYYVYQNRFSYVPKVYHLYIVEVSTCIVMISAPDPEYGFKKKLDLKKHGETKKPVKLKCKVDDPNARVKWYKDGVEIKPSDADYLMEVDDEGNVTLTIRKAELKDAGKYTCKIEEFGKEGENETSCQVTIGGNPPKKTYPKL